MATTVGDVSVGRSRLLPCSRFLSEACPPLQIVRGGVSIEAADGGWVIRGASIASLGEGRAELTSRSGTRTNIQDPDGLHLYMPDGGFAGVLPQRVDLDVERDQGFVPVQALAYVIDHSDNSLHIAWQPVRGADEYLVRVDNTQLDLTKEFSFLIPRNRIRDGQVLSVDAFDYDASKEEVLLGTMSLIISDRTLDQASAAVDGEAVTAAAGPATTELRYITFIPEEFIAAPPWPVCSGGGLNRFFKGDNRSWNANSTLFRTRARVVMHWADDDRNDTFREVKATHLYSRSPSGVYSHVESRTASSSGIKFNFPLSTLPPWIARNARVVHNASNPFCWSIAAIDYEVAAWVVKDSGDTTVQMSGWHDRVPNYEFYYRNDTGAWTTMRRWTHGTWVCLSQVCSSVSFSVTK